MVPRIARFRSVADLREHLATLAAPIPLDHEPLSAAAGFEMVDIKACHGYLVHEFFSARRRPGPWDGDFAGRTRLLPTLVQRVQAECPGLLVGVRLSLFDTVPWRMTDGHGEPWPFVDSLPYDCGFGVDESDPLAIDLTEPIRLLELLPDSSVVAVNLSAGSLNAACRPQPKGGGHGGLTSSAGAAVA